MRAAVGRVRREKIHLVVAPVARAGELADGHQLDGRDAEAFQMAESRDHGVESAFACERPSVQFVEDVVGQVDADPCLIVPFKGVRIDDFRWAMHAQGLEA